MNLSQMIKAAKAEVEIDLLLKNGRVIDVFTGEIALRNIAVHKGRIAGFGDFEAKKTIDLEKRYVAPGFIDAHVHIESSMLWVNEFAEAVAARGTTAAVADPHEIANVMGIEGIRRMMDASDHLPLNLYFALPSCVPAGTLETSGATLDAESLKPLMPDERVKALGEVMNYPGVLAGDSDLLKKIEFAKQHGLAIDGHAPGLTGKELAAYVSCGISSDHECTCVKEALEKLSLGMHIMIRQGTCAKNLDDLLPVINQHTYRRIMWCTDDRNPADIMDVGHIDSMIRRSVEKRVPPVTAIIMATLNPALFFKLDDVGAVAPGKKADLVILSDLSAMNVERVFFNGVPVEEIKRVSGSSCRKTTDALSGSIKVNREEIDFSIPAASPKARVVEIVQDQIITNSAVEVMKIENGLACSDPARDILKLAVIERHRGTNAAGKGFVRGFGLKKGAIGSTVAHDSHNIIIAGVDDSDMEAALEQLIKIKGGMVVIADGNPAASLPLPVAGLMSLESIDKVRAGLDGLIKASKESGCVLPDPFVALSFLSLSVIPHLKLTDKGLVDVAEYRTTDLFIV